MTCCCCGAAAGHHKQWFNRDHGYAICLSCIVCQLHGATPVEELYDNYGYPGANYPHLPENLTDAAYTVRRRALYSLALPPLQKALLDVLPFVPGFTDGDMVGRPILTRAVSVLLESLNASPSTVLTREQEEGYARALEAAAFDLSRQAAPAWNAAEQAARLHPDYVPPA